MAAVALRAGGWMAGQGRASSTRFVYRDNDGKADPRVGTAHDLRRKGLLWHISEETLWSAHEAALAHTFISLALHYSLTHSGPSGALAP
jgi:hypothetical protein